MWQHVRIAALELLMEYICNVSVCESVGSGLMSKVKRPERALVKLSSCSS